MSDVKWIKLCWTGRLASTWIDHLHVTRRLSETCASRSYYVPGYGRFGSVMQHITDDEFTVRIEGQAGQPARTAAQGERIIIAALHDAAAKEKAGDRRTTSTTEGS